MKFCERCKEEEVRRRENKIDKAGRKGTAGKKPEI